MVTPRKRKNAADHGSMKINRFFKPIKNTVVHTPSENNDENLPPQGQSSTEKKRAFGQQQSLSKIKPLKTPLKDRNPEVRISTTSQNGQTNRASFSVLKDDDIKKGVVKVPQREQQQHKESKVVQSSQQPSSQTGSTYSSQQSNNSQKDDFVTKIKPKKLFTVFNDSQEEQDEDRQSQSSQTSHSQQGYVAAKQQQKRFSIHLDDDITDVQSQSSQTSCSQLEEDAIKQNAFSIFLDDQDDQISQTSCSQQESTVVKKKPFAIFMDNEEEEESIHSSPESYFPQEDVTQKRRPFSVLIDNTSSEYNDNDQSTHSQEETAPKQKLFSIFVDNNNSEEEGEESMQSRQQHSKQQINTHSENNTIKCFPIYVDNNEDGESGQKETFRKNKPKKLFSVYTDENEPAPEGLKDDVVGFTIFRDEESTAKQTETRVLRDKTKESIPGNNYPAATDNFFDNDDEDDEFRIEELNDLLTFTKHQSQEIKRETKNEEFFSDDGDSDSYSEIIPLHNDSFSTACEPLTADDSEETTETHFDANKLHSDSSESDSKDTNDTTPPVKSNTTTNNNDNDILEPDQSIVSLNARTLSPSYTDLVEEVHVAYPNPRGDSLSEKLGLTKK